MKFRNLGRKAAALVSMLALGVGLSSCGSGTIGYLYVLGSLTNSGNFGQISAFKIDDQTGNLTNIVNSPFGSGGVNPGNAVVFPGGRFLFVLDKGTGGTTGSIAEFLVGGDGVLSFQQSYFSQGLSPQWISVDASGRYLYVLDQVNPTGYIPAGGSKPVGDITVFSVDSNTGRLTLVPNQQLKNADQTLFTFFPVGLTPTMLRVVGGYVYTLDAGDQSINIYTSGTGGQLVATANTQTTISTAGTNLTSINSDPGGKYIFLTDAGNNMLLQFTISTSGSLAALPTGNTTLPALTSNPVWVTVSQNSKFLYVLNQGNNTNPITVASAITAYTISSTTGQLQLIPDSPYPAGSGPVCMVEDPTNQYVFVSNHNDSTVTGYVINANTGQLSSLPRSTVFPISGQASCLTVSGYTT